MTDKNIQMTQRNADNTGWDNLFPKTKVENVEGAAKKIQEGWITPAFINGWTLLAGYFAGYYKDEFGTVHIRACVTGGTPGSAAFVMPVGYRIGNDHYYSDLGNSGGGDGLATVGVLANGNILASISNKNFISVSYKAER